MDTYRTPDSDWPESFFLSLLNFLLLQPSQPLLRIANFRETGIGVLPEVEEFLVIDPFLPYREYLSLTTFSFPHFGQVFLIGGAANVTTFKVELQKAHVVIMTVTGIISAKIS